ncbi:MAG: hypothetical protein ACKPKO_64130, partial [Candidatus Fonsibacter sp.]
SGTTTFMSMAPTVGIKHFTYTVFNNNYVYNISDIVGINNSIGGTGVFSAARGSYNYLQVYGGTYIIPTAPSTKCIYLGQSSTTSYGSEMTALDDTTIDSQRLELTTNDEYNTTTRLML